MTIDIELLGGGGAEGGVGVVGWNGDETLLWWISSNILLGEGGAGPGRRMVGVELRPADVAWEFLVQHIFKGHIGPGKKIVYFIKYAVFSPSSFPSCIGQHFTFNFDRAIAHGLKGAVHGAHAPLHVPLYI